MNKKTATHSNCPAFSVSTDGKHPDHSKFVRSSNSSWLLFEWSDSSRLAWWPTTIGSSKRALKFGGWSFPWPSLTIISTISCVFNTFKCNSLRQNKLQVSVFLLIETFGLKYTPNLKTEPATNIHMTTHIRLKSQSVVLFFLSFIPRWSQRLTGMGNGPSTRKCCAVKDSCGAGREVDASVVCQKRGGKELVFQADYQLNICLWFLSNIAARIIRVSQKYGRSLTSSIKTL